MSAVAPAQPLALVCGDIEGSSQLWEGHVQRFSAAVEAHHALLPKA